jgi:tetratricopeptide (TPR) repeat protein
MSSATSESSAVEDRDLRFPVFRSPAYETLNEIVDRIRGTLHRIPEQSACENCGESTASLVLVSVSHADFYGTLPISICYQCSKRPPFVAKAVDDRFMMVASLTGLAVIWGIGRQWVLSAMTFAGAVIAILRMKAPIRMSAAERDSKIREMLCRIPDVGLLMEHFPNVAVAVPLKDASVSRTVSTPLAIFDENLIFHEQIQIFCNRNDLNRSGVRSAVLTTMLQCVIDATKDVLKNAALTAPAAVQVNVAILPDRKTVFDVQVYPRVCVEIKNELTDRLSTLPPVPVNYPVVFCVSRCSASGGKPLNELPQPCLTWWKQLGQKAGLSYTEIALQAFNVVLSETSSVMSADECAAWRIYSPMNQSLGFEHVRLLQSENRLDDAIGVFEGLIANVPNDAGLRYQYASFLEQAERQERAASVCQQLVHDFPALTEIYGFLAHLQLQMNRPQDALQTMLSAPEEGRSARYWLTRARVAVELQDMGSAMGYLSTAILKDQTFPDPYLKRARLLAARQKYSAALDDVVRYEKLVGPTLESTQIKAGLFKQLGQIDQSVTVFSEAIAQHPDQPLFLLLRADYLADAGKLELARADCDAIIQKSPEFGAAYELRARINVENDDAEMAIEDCEQCLAKSHGTSRVYMYRGVAKLMKDNPDGAFSDLSQACEIDPENVVARYHLARVKAVQGLHDDAAADLSAVLQSAPEWTDPRIARGFLSLTNNDLETAAKDFDEVLRLAPQCIDAYRGRSLVYEAKDQPQEALRMLDKALLRDPDDPACRLNRSNLLLAEDDLAAAMKDLDSVLSSAPDLLPALLSRAHVRMFLGDLSAAQKDFDLILRDHPDCTPALIGRSVVWDSQGETDRSMQDLDAAIQTSPEHARSIEVSRLVTKASLAQRNQQYDDAIHAASEAIELEPENYQARRYRAGAYWYSEQFVNALQDYTHLIEVQEEPDVAAYNGRGQVYAELGDYELAVQDLEQAVEIGRKSDPSALPYSLSGLGKALAGLGRLEEAELAFRESLALKPDNAWLHFNRGLLYLTKNEPREAGLCFELSLRLSNPKLSPRKSAKAQGFVDRLKQG